MKTLNIIKIIVKYKYQFFQVSYVTPVTLTEITTPEENLYRQFLSWAGKRKLAALFVWKIRTGNKKRALADTRLASVADNGSEKNRNMQYLAV